MKHLLVEKSIKKIECNKTIKKKSSERTNKSSCLVICLIFAVIKAKTYKLSAVKNHSTVRIVILTHPAGQSCRSQLHQYEEK